MWSSLVVVDFSNSLDIHEDQGRLLVEVYKGVKLP